jgi:hypothetical protein
MLASGAFSEVAIPPDFDPEHLATLRAKRSELYDYQVKDIYGWHVFRKTSKDLMLQHRVFKEMLAWLCSRKDQTTDEREVQKHLRKFGRVLWHRFPDGPADRRFLGYLKTHGVSEFKRHPHVLSGRVCLLSQWKHPIDPFCAFLLEQCAGKLPTELPVRLCARRECRRFFTFFRNTGKFCSSSCRARSHGTPETRRKYMREWRAKKLSPGVQRRKKTGVG